LFLVISPLSRFPSPFRYLLAILSVFASSCMNRGISVKLNVVYTTPVSLERCRGLVEIVIEFISEFLCWGVSGAYGSRRTRGKRKIQRESFPLEVNLLSKGISYVAMNSQTYIKKALKRKERSRRDQKNRCNR